MFCHLSLNLDEEPALSSLSVWNLSCSGKGGCGSESAFSATGEIVLL